MSLTYLDFGIIAVFVIFFFIGIKNGFIDTILGFVGGLVSLIVAILLADKAADLLYGVFGIGVTIDNSVTDFLVKLLNPDNNPANQFVVPIGSEENITALVSAAISQLGLPEGIAGSISTSIAASISSALEGSGAGVLAEKSLVQILSPVLSRMLLLIISTILIFIAIRIVVAIIEGIAKLMLKTSKSLRGLNRLLGGVVGLAQGALVVVIIFTAGFFFISGAAVDPESPDLKAKIRTMVDQSQIGKIIYEMNPVPKLITDNIDLNNIIGGLFNRDGDPTPSVSPEATETPSAEPTAEPTVEPTPEPTT